MTAFRYARQLHQSQKRKGTIIPYISHLMTGSDLVVEHGGNEDQASLGSCMMPRRIKAALTGWRTYEPSLVMRSPRSWQIAPMHGNEPRPLWRPRKEDYLRACRTNRRGHCSVSLADKTHNAEVILFDYRELGDSLWDRFNGSADGTRWYYGALADCFAKVMSGRLSDRLSRAVEAFAR
jgi:hypothetical protein